MIMIENPVKRLREKMTQLSSINFYSKNGTLNNHSIFKLRFIKTEKGKCKTNGHGTVKYLFF